MSSSFPHPQSPPRLYGLNFSPYAGAQSPIWESPQPSEAQIRRRLSLIASSTGRIRVFNSTGVSAKVMEIALAMGFEVMAGAWISANRTENEIAIEALWKWGNHPGVTALLVGNEVMARGDLPYSEWVALIRRTKASCPNQVVSSAVVIDTLRDHPDLPQELDAVCVNLHPYFAEVTAGGALAELQHQYRLVQALAAERPVIISETGWPCDDGREGAEFFAGFLDWAEGTEIPYYYFEAFDEPWKVQDEGSWGGHFGLWGDDEQIKPGFKPLFFNDQITIL